MSDALVDFAMVDSAVPTDSAVETQTTEVETPVEGTETQTTEVETPVEGTETETTNADGSEKSEEERIAFKEKSAKKEDLPGDEKTPQDIRKALKAFRDTNPTANGEMTKQLHNSYERWNAAKAIFPKGVAEMQEVKAFVDSIGGPEGYEKLQAAVDAVTAVDELLYAADPKIWENVIEDLKASGHPEALAALAPSFLSKLKAHDEEGYYNTTIPVVANALKEVHMDSFVNQFNAALTEKNEKGEVVPNLSKITGLVKSITDWYTDLDKDAKARTATPTDTPERKKFLEEKAAFEKTKTEAATQERTKFENGVAEDCDKRNNDILGKALGAFLKMPYFKEFPYETKVDLGNGIKARLYDTLKGDKAYQLQMNAMWKQKTPDRAKMIQYHEAKVQSIANDIVTKTVQARYPGYAKGGSAAGKAAAAVVKRETAAKVATQSVATGKPIYVASRPENLIREAIKVGGKDYSASDLVTLQIVGRGFVKSTDGKSVKFITWRK